MVYCGSKDRLIDPPVHFKGDRMMIIFVLLTKQSVDIPQLYYSEC